MMHSDITGRILKCAVAVHRALGPGLRESAYQAALRAAMTSEQLEFVEEPCLPVKFEGVTIATQKPDFIVENKVVVELKAVKLLEPSTQAQMLSYLRLSGCHVGLLLNFNAPSMNHGISRFVLNATDAEPAVD